MTIAHTGIRTPAAQHADIVAWYEAALAPLGYTRGIEFFDGLVVAFKDADGNQDWWIKSSVAGGPNNPSQNAKDESGTVPVLAIHTAFVAKDRATVDAFHTAALAAGGKCNGPPGVRQFSGPNYYAAFVLDPAGNNIEAIYNGPA